MASPRPPPWLVYPTLVFLLLAGALRHRGYADAPPTPPPLPSGEGAVLAQASPLDLVATVRVRSGDRTGAAFSVADNGVWLTSKRTLARCAHPAIVVAGASGAPAKVVTMSGGDLAVLTTTAGAPALPMATPPLRDAEFGFAAGFPGGRAGEAASRLLGRRTLYLRQRGAHAETVLAWAEAGRTEGLTGRLTPGLGGAPMLDRDGAVVGVVLADEPRRGRLYATTPEAVADALDAAKSPAAAATGLPLTPDNYGLAADDLRRSLRIAAVACGSG